MAAGDRIPLVSGTQFQELEQKVSADDTGLIPRVIALETSSGKGVKKHQTDIQYDPEDVVVKDDFFYEALEATTGTFNTTKWKKIGVSKPYDPIVMRQFLLEGGSGDLVAKIVGNKLVVEMLNQQVGENPRAKRTFDFDGDTGLFRLNNPNYTIDPQDNDVVTLKYLNGIFLRSDFQTHDDTYTKDLNDMVAVDGRHRIRTPLTNGPTGFGTTHSLSVAHTYNEWVRSTDGKLYKLQTVIGFSPLTTYRRLVEVESNGSYLTGQTTKPWIPDVTKEYVLVNTENFTWDDTKKRLTQKDAPTEVAVDDLDILTLKDAKAIFQSKLRLKLPDEVDLNTVTSANIYWGNNVTVTNKPPMETSCDSYILDVEVVEVADNSFKIRQVVSTIDKDSATDYVLTWVRVGEFINVNSLTFTDWVALGGSGTVSGTANTVPVFNVDGDLVSSAITNSELSVLDGGAANSDSSISDTDKFIFNDAGVMKQTGFNRLWLWISSKLTGAVSTILINNLTSGKVVGTDTNGKIFASTYDIGSIERVANGMVKVHQTKPASGTRTHNVVNRYSGFRVWFEVTSSTITFKIDHNVATAANLQLGWFHGGRSGAVSNGAIRLTDNIFTSISTGDIGEQRTGSLMVSTAGAPTDVIFIQYSIHNNDSDEYCIFCQVF